ncbi:hypothetical protein HN011_012481 [Eciton burchellii]|nr:hypothetical protein HN011_012481 [Eciton burchellii]
MKRTSLILLSCAMISFPKGRLPAFQICTHRTKYPFEASPLELAVGDIAELTARHVSKVRRKNPPRVFALPETEALSPYARHEAIPDDKDVCGVRCRQVRGHS